MKTTILPATPFQQNCSLLVCEETNRAAIVDPGGDIDTVLDAVERCGTTVEKILLTHVRWLAGGDTVRFGNVEPEVRHVPGHTPGHVVFYSPANRLAITGDVLFADSIGRTDFPRGDHDTLIRSIREQFRALGDDVRFLPGHGPPYRAGTAEQSLRRGLVARIESGVSLRQGRGT